MVRWDNPNAVVQMMMDGEFQSFWSGTASYEAIVPLVNMNYDELKSAIIEMLSGDQVKIDVTSFQNYTGDILLVGINYDKEGKEHQCLIEKYEKE